MKKFNITFTTYNAINTLGVSVPEKEMIIAHHSSMGDKSVPVGTIIFYNESKEAIAVFHNVKSCVKIGE